MPQRWRALQHSRAGGPSICRPTSLLIASEPRRPDIKALTSLQLGGTATADDVVRAGVSSR